MYASLDPNELKCDRLVLFQVLQASTKISCYHRRDVKISQLCANHIAYTMLKHPWCEPSDRHWHWYADALSLTHWGRVTHICVNKPTNIGSDNGLLASRRQAIIWTNALILSIWSLGTNFSEILIKIHTFSLKKMHSKCRLENGGLDVLNKSCHRNVFEGRLFINTRRFQILVPDFYIWADLKWRRGCKDTIYMMTSSNGNIFRVTGHLCGEFTSPRWIPRTKASDAEL